MKLLDRATGGCVRDLPSAVTARSVLLVRATGF